MKYVKRPVVIDAILISDIDLSGDTPNWVCDAFSSGDVMWMSLLQPHGIVVRTLEGDMIGRADDYLIRGVMGELYPCRPDVFAATYRVCA